MKDQPTRSIEPTPDIFSLLEHDHRRIHELLDQILKEGIEGRNAGRLFSQAERELELHSSAEEHALYPWLAGHAETHDYALEAQEDHNAIRHCLHEIELISPRDDRFFSILQNLKVEVEAHVQQEESRIFAKMRELLAPEDLRQIATEFLAAKQALREGTIAA